MAYQLSTNYFLYISTCKCIGWIICREIFRYKNPIWSKGGIWWPRCLSQQFSILIILVKCTIYCNIVGSPFSFRVICAFPHLQWHLLWHTIRTFKLFLLVCFLIWERRNQPRSRSQLFNFLNVKNMMRVVHLTELNEMKSIHQCTLSDKLIDNSYKWIGQQFSICSVYSFISTSQL